MFTFFGRLFGREVPDSAPAGETEPGLGELIQRLARAQARLGLEVEETARKVEAGFEDLRGQLRASGNGAGAGPRRELAWDPLLDALDLLAEAERHAAAEAPRFATGLGGIRSRLEAFLAQGDLTRIGTEGAAADGKLFRVVGTDVRADLPAGTIARVVRAAVRRGGDLVREGEVLVSVAPVQETSS